MHWVVVSQWGELIQFESIALKLVLSAAVHSNPFLLNDRNLWGMSLKRMSLPPGQQQQRQVEECWNEWRKNKNNRKVNLPTGNNNYNEIWGWFWRGCNLVKRKKKERKGKNKTKRRKCVVTWLKQVTARHPSSWHSVTCSWGLWHLIFDFDVNFHIFDCLCLCLCLTWQTFMKLVNAFVFVVVFVFEFVFVFIFLFVILFVFVFVLCLLFSVTWLPLRKLGSSSKWNRTIRWPSFTFLQGGMRDL